MNAKPSGTRAASRARRRAANDVKQALRGLSIELSLLNRQVGTSVGLRDIDLDCFDLIDRHGPLSPSTLARLASLHPATVTGILDRLERGGWVTRDRDATDRRGVIIRPSRDRMAELLGQYAGMNAAMDELCAGYDEVELVALAEFLRRTSEAGRSAVEKLADQ